MTQDDSSTSSGAAAGDAVPVSFPDLTEEQKEQLERANELVTDQICNRLNGAMREDDALIRAGAVPLTDGEYSPDTRDLLRRAWTIAAQLQHRKVVADHLIAGIVTGDDESIRAPSPAGVDLATLRSRIFARLAGLPTAPDDLPVSTQPVEPDVVRWISGAVCLAQVRDEYSREVLPDDLVQVVQNARQPDHPLHNLLQDVVDRFDTGKQLAPAGSSPLPSPGALVQVESGEVALPSADMGNRIFRAIRSAHKTASYARTELRTRVWETQLPRLAVAVDECRDQLVSLDRQTAAIRVDVTGIGSQTAEIQRNQFASLAAVRDGHAILDRIDHQITEIRDNLLPHLAETVGDCRNRTTAIMASLPRPPATGWIALAIVIVLVLGSAAGIALRQPSLAAAVEKLLKS
jgi:hypothetical protein